MKKFTILGGLMALALVIGMAASSFGAGKAEAKVKSAIMFNPDVCFTLTGAVAPSESWADFIADNPSPSPEDLAAYYGSFNCYGLSGYDVAVPNGNTPFLSFETPAGIEFAPNPAAADNVHVARGDALAEIADLLGGDVDNADTYAPLVDASDAQVGDQSYVHDYGSETAICDDDDNACDDATFEALTNANSELQAGDPFPLFTSEKDDGLLGILGGNPLATINSQSEWVIAFPSNDDDVTMEADEGVFLNSHDDNSEVRVSNDCGNGNDCQFVAIDLLFAGCELNSGDSSDVQCDSHEWDRTDMNLGAQTVDVYQENNNSPDVTVDYTVVGHPENFALTSLKTSITAAAGAACSLADVSTEIGLPDATLLIGKITDNDKTALTGLWVLWTSNSDTDVGSGQVKLSVPADVSIKSAAGDAAVNLACGKSATGAFDVHAGVWWPQDLIIEDLPVIYVDTEGISQGDTGALCSPYTMYDEPTDECSQPDADDEVYQVDVNAGGPFLGAMDFGDAHPTDVATITVIGGPSALELSVSPAYLVCNGTNSAVVTATVLNAAGKPVVAGVPVQFDVVALGTANPIRAVTDANGQAKTAVIPVGNVTAGVRVIVTADDLAPQSTVVSCQPVPLPTPATRTPTPTARATETSTPVAEVATATSAPSLTPGPTATSTPYGGAAPGLRGPPSVGTGSPGGFSSGWPTWVLAVLLGTGLSLLTVTALARYRRFKTWRD